MVRLILLVLIGAVWIALSEGTHQASDGHKKHVTRRIMAGPGIKKNNIFTRSLPHGKFMALKRNEGNNIGKGGQSSKCRQPGVCSGNGDCLDYGFYAENDEGYTCECFDGYYGDKCQLGNDVCNKPENVDICKNGGICYPGDNETFWCVCEEEYRGQYCELKCETAECFWAFVDKIVEIEDEVDDDTCKTLTDDLQSCIDNIKKDGVSVCGCDELDTLTTINFLEDTKQFQRDYCYNDFYACKDLEVQKCMDTLLEVVGLLPIDPYDIKKRNLPTHVKDILTDATSCLKELKDKGITETKGCPFYQPLLEAETEWLAELVRLELSGCPVMETWYDVCGRELCKDGDIDYDHLNQTTTCIRNTFASNEKCIDAEMFMEPTDDELKELQDECVWVKKVADYNTGFGCSANKEGKRNNQNHSGSLKKSLMSLGERIKNMKEERAAKYEHEERIKSLVSLLKKALAEK